MGLLPAILTAAALAHGADVYTSQQGFNRGFSETNPLMPTHPAAMIAIKSGWVVGNSILLSKLAHAHPKLAKTLGMIDLGTVTFAVVNNARQLRKRP